MYLSAEQRGYGGGRERLSSSTVSPSLVTTSREVRLKRPVLSYRSDAAATKGGPALNISGRCLPLWSQVERGRCLTVLMHMCARLQESELLTSDMKVNRTANAFVVQEIGASPPPRSVDLPFWIFWAERGVWSAGRGAWNPSKIPWIQKQCQYFFEFEQLIQIFMFN